MPTRLIPRASFFRSLFHSSLTAAVRPEFLTSSSARYVNPRQHTTGGDCITQTIPSSWIAGRSDEQVLALFTSGFFGGFVFALEWLLLTAAGGRILPVGYTGFTRDAQAARTLWRQVDVSDSYLHPIGTCLFGTFMVLDKHIGPQSELIENDQRTSWVDYGFGSDKSSFAGCHRFQITTTRAHQGEGKCKIGSSTETRVQIELLGFHCNPQTNQPGAPEILKLFHWGYAKMLFANGVQSVLLGRA
ncbi:uncharacterized protein BP01DRAFT_351909 [Aspergillus saccharolyticus JOP 1030-1]|uniref:Uncharacterized protein n=1 Tax=Aspergillus saccharolyticus JOP 1030-1 TaxID=1450539 RepID=A0A318Z9E9_9EURO|nr:hypothetical protein BP01DRAFT_351909 [Aspergillus saccharolyticus JOP 1030-1]PYH40170.1 hypothetical protein BP01DRAFT_351909 [Aspergillus saccharolyticus JOP 1030-1]